MKYRNWIEKALGKQTRWEPVRIGMRGGRDLYDVEFTDGTEGTYYIDFERKTIEEDQQ